MRNLYKNKRRTYARYRAARMKRWSARVAGAGVFLTLFASLGYAWLRDWSHGEDPADIFVVAMIGGAALMILSAVLGLVGRYEV